MSIENLYSRNTGNRLSCNAIKRLTQEQVLQQFDDPNVALAIESNRSLMNALDQQINVMEQVILKQAKLDPRYRYLLSIGEILALTIMLETRDIGRFEQVGNFTSYCRCVGSKHLSIESDVGKATQSTLSLWERVRGEGISKVALPTLAPITVKRKVRATPKTAISIWHGHLLKRPTSRSVLTNKPNVSISAKSPKETGLSLLKRWPTN